MLSRDEVIGLKTLTGAAIDEIGSRERCAAISRVRPQAFSEYKDEADETHVIPLDVALSLDRYLVGRGKRAMFLPYAAQVLGFVAVQVSLPGSKGKLKPLGRMTGQAMRDVSEIFAALGKAIDDGEISSAEDARLEEKIWHGIERLVALQLEIRAAAKDNSAPGSDEDADRSGAPST